jgi:uncharacterized phage-associated protein
MFKESKTAQIAAYFLHKADSQMEHVKLMKLMYLADREALGTLGAFISDDSMYSMRMGPVLSQTLDLMSGNYDPLSEGAWSEWVSDKENHQVMLKKQISENDLDELSDAELSIMEKVYDRFGDWTMKALIDYTHGLKEWGNPGMGRIPIATESILDALGKTPEETRAILGYLEEAKGIDAALERL